MIFSKLNLDRKVGLSELAIENCRRKAPIMAGIALYKYDETRLHQGEEIITRIKKLTLQWNSAHSQKLQATLELQTVVREVKAVYYKTRRIAYLLFQNQEPQRRALAMNGRTKRGLSQWLEEARQFYTNALADPEIRRQFSGFGITAKTLNDEKNLLSKVEKAMANQEKKMAEAMEITRLRKLAIKELDEFMTQLHTVLRLALGKSQLLEAVGIVVK